MLEYILISIFISMCIYSVNFIIIVFLNQYHFERVKKRVLFVFIPFINVIYNLFILSFIINAFKDRNLTYDQTKEKYDIKMGKVKIGDIKPIALCKGTYLGGQEDLTEVGDGEIKLKDAYLEFKMINSKNEFKLPLRQISNLAYDTEKNLTLGRVLIFGIFALGMKKNNYYLVVDYINDYGINNQIVFDLGYEKNQEFFNKLNVQRNQVIKKYANKIG